MKITAITCVKNEGPFLIEWIAFHRLIGVTDFLFYSNDCTDGTAELLDGLEAEGLVTHLPNPAEGRNYQMEALKHARTQPIVKDADWVWIADVDEFLNIHVGDGSIPALIKACGNPNAISITFQFFANGGIETYEDKPVVAQFEHSHDPDIWTDQTAIEVKTLVRNDFPVKYYGAHRPFMKDKLAKNQRPLWMDASGREVQWKFRTAANKRRIRRFPAKGAREFAALNHYALRSLDSYLVKNDRGDVNRENRVFDDSYWRERNDAAFRDMSIQSILPKLKTEMTTLMKRKGIKALHGKCVKLHRAKCAELSALPEYQAMRTQLLATPDISPQEEAMLAMLEAS